MKAAARYWRAFRAWPQIAQMWAWLMLFCLVGICFVPKVFAQDDDGDIAVQVEGSCSPDGRLIGLRLFAPRVGIITIPIPEGVCKKPEKRPARQV